MEKSKTYSIGEMAIPYEWSYMDIVASVCLSIVACTVEREEVCRCMELLKKSFSIGQQRGCAIAKAKMKANVKKDSEGEAT